MNDNVVIHLKNGVPSHNGKPESSDNPAGSFSLAQLQSAAKSEKDLPGKAPVSDTTLSLVTAGDVHDLTDGVILPPKMTEVQQMVELLNEKLNRPEEDQLVKLEKLLIADAPNIYVDQVQNVHDMLVRFNDKLKAQLQLSGEPTIENVQRAAVQQPPLQGEDALDCAILVAYYIHDTESCLIDFIGAGSPTI